ncbi:MAG TPA: hypothetical protein VLA99_09595 [Nitrospiraceae bacterium]|nr:hypothetical protein [Nitrospiraceae bacterium]
MAMWIRYLNALLGGLVLTTGLWIAVGEISPFAAIAAYGLIAGALGWFCSSNMGIWAWTTLFFGAESLAWPISMMVRIKLAGMDPTEQQKQDMLTAILFGLFSSIFWFTFAYGLFKRTWAPEGSVQPSSQPAGDAAGGAPPGRRRRSQKGRRA